MAESIADVRASLAEHGHGHVVPTRSGLLARCGGPGLCQRCQRDQARLSAAIKECPNELERLLSLIGEYARACADPDERAIAAREASRAEVKRWHAVVVAARESLAGGEDAVGRLRQVLAEVDRGRS